MYLLGIYFVICINILILIIFSIYICIQIYNKSLVTIFLNYYVYSNDIKCLTVNIFTNTFKSFIDILYKNIIQKKIFKSKYKY